MNIGGAGGNGDIPASQHADVLAVHKLALADLFICFLNEHQYIAKAVQRKPVKKILANEERHGEDANSRLRRRPFTAHAASLRHRHS